MTGKWFKSFSGFLPQVREWCEPLGWTPDRVWSDEIGELSDRIWSDEGGGVGCFLDSFLRFVNGAIRWAGLQIESGVTR